MHVVMLESPSELIAVILGFGLLWLILGFVSKADFETRRERRRPSDAAERSRHRRAA